MVATDSQRLYDELRSTLEAPDTHLSWVRSGEAVRQAIDLHPADLVIADMQIGTMGGVAVALDLRLEADAGRLAYAPVLLLLDRRADVFLARRSGAEGFVIKPLDPLRLRRAVRTLLSGGRFEDPSFAPEPLVVRAGQPRGGEG